MNMYHHRLFNLIGVLTLTVVTLLVTLLSLNASRPAYAAPGDVCFATIDGITVYSNTDAKPVRDALAAASAGNTVKVAGYCAGAVSQSGTTQVALITKTLTLAGGYTNTLGGWDTAYPITQPTTLDAQGGGRVIYATAAATLRCKASPSPTVAPPAAAAGFTPMGR